MQVKKFEAKTMKEAIDLVKFHMGPDAVILSAKENVKKYGLMGEASIEVTAAVSDSKLRQKHLAEKKLDSKTKVRYEGSSAKTQRDYISKVFEKGGGDQPAWEENSKSVAAPLPVVAKKAGPITSRRYIDIDDEAVAESAPSSVAPQAVIAQPVSIQTATVQMANDTSLTQNLQTEVRQLRGLLSQFKSVPQSFVRMHPGAEFGLPFELSHTYKRLLDTGMAEDHVVHLMKMANEAIPSEQRKKRAFVDGWVIRHLLNDLQVVPKPYENKFHIFVGTTGQGKTSSLIKMACDLILNKKKRVALLSSDTIKVGAIDQLKTYAQILNAPYSAIQSPQDWIDLAPALDEVDYVFLDTAGLNLKDPHGLNYLRSGFPPQFKDLCVHYVQSAVARDQEAFEIANRFRAIGFSDVIFTKLDEAVQFGLIYNFHKKFNVPIHSFGIGGQIPEDFELATKERIVDLLFNLSQFREERVNP
jgi:flagellar biosynthesis protein FlhF